MCGEESLRRWKKTIGLGVICLILAETCGGCGRLSPDKMNTGEEAEFVSMERAPVIEYEVPVFTPNILVDRNGYQARGGKVAVVKGAHIPAEFRLVDCGTGEVVYTGQIKDAVYDKGLGIYTGRADFGEYLDGTGGPYFLECDRIGRSYEFPIRETRYQELFEELYGELADDCEAGRISVEEVLALLVAYERYGAIFPDQDEDEIPDVMEMLQKWTEQIDPAGAQDGPGALYAEALAKFSYLFQYFDREFANACLQKASAVFTQTTDVSSEGPEIFWALTELYRATGLSTYGNRIKGYKSTFEDNHISCIDETGYLFGSMTYMVTRQRVDTDLCQRFMDTIMGHAEEMSVDYQEMIDPVSDKNAGTEELLKCAAEMSCANYILNNYQYTSILEEFLHYLMGRNLRSENFYEKEEDRAEYLLLLAQLAAGTPWQEREGV